MRHDLHIPGVLILSVSQSGSDTKARVYALETRTIKVSFIPAVDIVQFTDRALAYPGRLRNQLVDHALDKFKDKSFKVHIEKVFNWDQIQEAHRLMESNQTKGKLICVIPDK